MSYKIGAETSTSMKLNVSPEDHIRNMEDQIKKLFERNQALSHANDQVTRENMLLRTDLNGTRATLESRTRGLEAYKTLTDTLRHHAACWVELMNSSNEMLPHERIALARLVKEIEKTVIKKASGR